MKRNQRSTNNFSKIFRALAVGATFIAVTAVGVNASGSALAAAVSEFFGWTMPARETNVPDATESVNPHSPIGRNRFFDRVITGELSSLMGIGVEFTTAVYADDFSTNNSATYTTSGAIGASGWSVLRSGADWGARRHTTTTRLELTNDVGGTANANGWVLATTAASSFSTPYNTILSSNPGPVSWTFNMRQSQANPAGFAAGNYGVAFIVAGTSTTNNNTGSGYAVVLGQSGTTDPIRLARYSGGIQGTMTNIITSNTAGLTDFGTDFLSVKVVYTPSTNTWELLLRNDGGTTFADPATGTLTSQGTAVDSISTGTPLALMGGWWQGATAAGQPAFFDNTVVSVETPSPGTVQFGAGSDSALEGTTKSIIINRVGGSLGAASVDYATGGGSATGGAACTAGVDYISTSGTLFWANGDAASKTFDVVLCADGVTDTENLQLTLSNPSGTTIAGTNPATLDIIDNPPGTLQFTAPTFVQAEGTTVAADVSRTGGNGGAVSVDYAVTGGNATGGAACAAGVDYIAPSGSLNWASVDGANKTINVQLCPDFITYEGPETIDLTLSNVQGGATLGTPVLTTITINDAPANFSNPSAIGIPNSGPSPLYPSNITVAGVPGTISNLTVTLTNVTHTYPDDIFVLLVGPGGQTFVLQGLAGGGGNITNRTYVFSDLAANLLADETSNPAGTYKPTNYFPTAGWPPPAPGAPYSQPGPFGTDTLNGIFGGTVPNGTWSLFVNDFADPDGGAINGGWSLQIQTTVPLPGTMEFTAANYPANEGSQAVIEVSRVNGSLGAASVDYATGGGTATGGASCAPGIDYINTSGSFTWADGEFGSKTFNVQTCGDSDLGEADETLNLTLSNPAGILISGTNPATLTIVNNAFGGTTFSNHGSITIPDSGAASPYPSTITVSGVTGTVSDLRLRLNDISHTFGADTIMLLVGPQGQRFVPFSNVGGSVPIDHATVLLHDSALNFVPPSVFSSGTYKPTNYGAGDFFPPPAPGGPHSEAGPDGSGTFVSTFGGTDPNGTWSLYVFDVAGGDQGTIAGGWDLDIQTATPVPGTVEFSSASYNGSEGGTATITAKRVGGSLGAVSVDYATSDGTGMGGAACGAGVDYVSASGTFNWADGDAADKSFAVSLCSDPLTGEPSETANLTLSNPVGTAITGTNPAVLNIENNSFDGSIFSNPASINIPGSGTASPYPSTITVSGMTGAITEVRMVLKNFSHTYTSDVDILLVGPQGQKFVAMSDVAGNNPIGGLTLSLYDAAAANMTSGPLASGSYKPTDIAAAPDTWPAPAPAGPYNSPAPWGGMTFGSVFNGSDPNGVWSLYVYDSIFPDGGSIADGWDLQIASAETVRFNPADYITTETAGTVSLTVVRASSDNAATVDYTLPSAGALYPAVGGASCGAGIDYVNTPGIVNFGIGELTRNIDITLCDDGVFDGLKIILPELSNPTGGLVLGSPSVATVFINDNETPPTLSISDVTVNEADGTASFLVTQSFITNSLTQFLYSTSDGSALAGFDYTGATNATGTIPAGSTTTNIVVPILQDIGFEETETFSVAFTNIINGNAADPVGVGTITDDDTAASYVVTTTNNVNDGTCDGTHCSLREAINASNAAPGIITFAPSVTGTITFSASRPQITNNTVINGPGAHVLAVSGNNVVTVFDIPNPGTAVTIRGLTVRNGFNLDFAAGGAITNNALLLVENSVITASRGNFAGAIQTFAPLTIRNSTLSNNVGGNDGLQPGCSNIGGAIDSSNDVTINIINSTISGNSVSTNCSANAGAINLFAGRVVITNSTITNNTGSNFSGAIDGGSASTSIVRNSIIAGNTGDPSEPDMNDILFESQGFNIIGNPGTITAFNQPTDQTGTTGSPLNPGLGALANNGGTTPTHAPLTGSPALDKGNSFGLTTDQRGSGRPYDDPGTANAAGGDGSDIGAYEAIVPVISVTSGPLSFGSVLAGGFSAEQSYTVSGMNLTGDLTVTAPAGFQVSTTSGSGFGPSVTLTHSGGSVATTTIYVRFAPASPGAVSGNITNESPGAATANVAVSGTGASAGSLQFTTATFSDSETNSDHTYNVTVSRTGGSFGAVTVDYSVTDGTATTADNDYTSSSSGNLNWADGDTADKQIEITIKGDTKFETDETIGLSLTDPEGGVVLGSPSAAVLTITNDDAQPAISVDDIVFTGDSLAPNAFTVTLSNPSSQAVTVHYQTANDTAVSGEDYTAASGTFTFNPGETSKDVPVTILPDTVNEATEQFFLNLDTPVNATIGDGQGVGTIPNDDPDVSFSIDDVTHTEGNSGTVSYTFTITKTGSTAQTTSLAWSTVNGSAIAPGDFAAVAATTLSFLPAETTKQATVQVNGDTSFESDETFIVRLSNPVNASLTDGDGLGTIQNDDAPQIFLVNVNSDTDDGTCNAANCSLREAINAVNVAGGQIDFAPNVTGSISLLSALPPLASSNATVINGPGAGVLAVKRDSSVGALRIFDVQGSGVFTISGLAINDGEVRPIGGAFNNLGGGIRIMAGHGVTINNCTFTNNWANNGAAIYNGANPATSPLTVNNSTFTANNANQSGGGIENRFSNELTVNGSTFDANGANNFGGGIHNIASGVVFINDSIFTGNVANAGGAINNDDTGSLTIKRTTISGNQAVVGGGIYNKNGGLDVFNSTISGNNASEGGGAYNHVATMNFYNSTISGNTATSIGGGIYYTFQGASHGTIQNCTITGNQGPNGGGVMVFNGGSVVRAGNTILAANTGNQGPDLYGTIYSNGYNILGTLGGTWGHMDPAPGDQIGQFSVINPLLGPLQNNGGPTKTRLPLTGSPAIDAGNAFGETADQRGFTRTVNGTTDTGAVELQPAPTQISAFAGSPQSVTEGTAFAPLQARVLDASNAPVGGVSVTFTAPASGPSGLFANSSTQTTAITDANGVATSSVLTANNTAGSFSATAAFAASPMASFNLTIVESPRAISVNDVTFTGADSLVGSGFTVSLSAPSVQTITVHYQTADSTAIAGEDYTSTSGTLTFNPGETSQNVPVTILPDTVNEVTEQFFLNLDTPVNATIADGQGIGTIPNDDPEVSFSIDDIAPLEGTGGTTSFTFTITKNGSTSQTTSVNWATADGTGIAPGDYTAVSSMPVTFLPGDTSKQVTVLVNGDGNYEQNETFTVVLSLPVNATIADGSGLGTITNDDAIPSFSIDDVTHNEGNSGTISYTFTVTKTGASELDSTVQFETQDGTATLADNDYQSNTGTLNFLAAEASKQVTVIVNSDFLIEPDENFIVHLQSATAAAISDADGTGTIVNDDFTPLNTYVDDDWTALTNGADPDGAGPANAIGYDAFDTIQEGINAVAASGQVNVFAGTYDEDVNANNPGVRIIGAGSGNTNIRGPIGGPGSTLQITASNVTVAGFTVTRLGNNTTDWNNPGLNSAGVALQGQAITGAVVRDNIITGNRTAIDINNSNGHTVRNNVIDSNRIGLIFRNQTDSMTVVENSIANNWAVGVVFLDASGGTDVPQQTALGGTFKNNNISGNWYGQIVDRQSGGSLPAPGTTNLKNFKGNWFGTTTPVVTTANTAEPGYAAQIPIAYGGTAAAPGGQPDIAGPASANFQYQPQLLSGVDTDIETTPGRGTFGFQGVANVPILDTRDHTFTGVDSLGVSQGFTVTLTGDTNQIVTVHYQTADGTALDGQDYTGVSGTLTFDPGETSKVIPVDILPDSVQEVTEQFTIDLDTPVNAGILDGNAIGTIPNDDAAPTFAIDNVSHSEGNSGIVNYVFTVTKTGGTALPSSIDFATQNDSGSTSEGDFQATSGTLNFGPADATMQITVQVNGDVLFENDEQFQVILTNPVNASVTNGTGVGSILNDDAPPTIAIDDVTMTEGDSGTKTFTFTITKTGQTAFNGGVDYVVQDGTATSADGDYVASSGNIGFPREDMTKTVSVTVNGDTTYENNETFVVHLQNEGGLVVSRRDGTGTITNDDAAPTLSIGDVTFTGSDSMAVGGFAVTLTGATEIPVTVHYQTSDDTAIAGQDYTAASGTLTFNPGETQVQNIPVAILPDTTQEGTEQFFMNLDTPVGATIADGQGVGTIPNDDAAPSFSIDNVTQSESAGGFTTFVFFVTKTGATALPSSIDYTTQAGTATAGAACGSGVDYESRSGTLNFAAADTSQMVLVNVCGDTVVETDETFTVNLSNAVNGSITEGGGLGTIQNDTTPAVQFQSATYLEDESQTAVITLIRTGNTSGSSEVTVATSNGTATGGSCSTLGVDYASISTMVTFDPTETMQTVNVPVCMDTLFETTFETVNLALSSNTTVLGDQSTAILNVNDTAAQFKSSTPITIGDGGPANPYPAAINVSGAPSVTGTMRITLFDLTHANPEDLDILLVAPNGQSMVLMADAGGSNALTGNGATITFDESAGAVLPDNALIATGKYEPTTWGSVTPFTAPAPGGPYAMPNSTVGGSINLNSVFGTAHPNGTWQLFIRDQNGLPPLGAGQIAAGWGLQFLAPTEASASISGRVTTAGGNGIRNAIVKLTGGNLAEPRYAQTGAFGSYVFDNLPVGQTYVVQVSAKRFRFAQPTMVITLQDATMVDFTANPQE